MTLKPPYERRPPECYQAGCDEGSTLCVTVSAARVNNVLASGYACRWHVADVTDGLADELRALLARRLVELTLEQA